MEETEDFDSFYAAAFARLVGQLALVTGHRHEAEDVIQEAVARAAAGCTAAARATSAGSPCLGGRAGFGGRPPGLTVANRQVVVLYYLADGYARTSRPPGRRLLAVAVAGAAAGPSGAWFLPARCRRCRGCSGPGHSPSVAVG